MVLPILCYLFLRLKKQLKPDHPETLLVMAFCQPRKRCKENTISKFYLVGSKANDTLGFK